MGFGAAIGSAFRHYARFSGRAARSEYWWFYLFLILLFAVTLFIDGFYVADPDPQNIPYVTLGVGLAVMLPGLSVSIRRLHDTNRSGWWYLVQLVPAIGSIILLLFYVMRGTDGTNRFGPDPLAVR